MHFSTVFVWVLQAVEGYWLPRMHNQHPIFTPPFSFDADAGHATFKISITDIHRLGES